MVLICEKFAKYWKMELNIIKWNNNNKIKLYGNLNKIISTRTKLTQLFYNFHKKQL